MIEHEGVRLHLDPKQDRAEGAPFEFTGWITADEPIRAVRLPEVPDISLTTSKRPDVQRIFADCATLGFAGECPTSGLQSDGLRVQIDLENRSLTLTHPVPAPLPGLSAGQRLSAAFQLAWWRWRERRARTPEQRFRFVLRRHLLARHLRRGIFQRRHTEALLADFATAFPEATILQIGANDGITGDPLYPLITKPATDWRGVLVEPVAHLFAQLEQRYANYPRLHPVRAAIGEQDGPGLIHRLRSDQQAPLWTDQLPSLDPALVQRNVDSLGEDAPELVAEEVAVLSVPTLLRQTGLNQIDLLVIDTEGWDWRILRQFDLERVRPRLILFEHQHLSAGDRERAHPFLRTHGYDFAETEEGDTLAWRRVG